MLVSNFGSRTQNISSGHLGNEGLRSFSATNAYDNQDNVTYDVFKGQVIRHFRRSPSLFKARYDFFTRRRETGESFDDFVLALRALAVDCAFEAIT